MAEVTKSWSVYHYAINNPIKFIDPNGLNVDIWELNKDSGELTWKKTSEKDIIYAVTSNTDGSTQRTGEFLEFDRKVISKRQVTANEENSDKTKEYSQINFISRKSAKKFYNWPIIQSGRNVGWSFLHLKAKKMKGFQTYSVFTSNMKGKEYGAASQAIYWSVDDPNDFEVIEMDHNHPDKEGCECTSDKDIETRNIILKANPNARFYLDYWENNKVVKREYTYDNKHYRWPNCGTLESK